MKMSCGEIVLRDKVKAKFDRTVTIGRAAVLTKAQNGRARVSLLRAVRARVQNVFVFQQPVHDGGGRAEFGELHADHECGCQPCGHGQE